MDINLKIYLPCANIVNKYINNRKCVMLGENIELENMLLSMFDISVDYIACFDENDIKRGDRFKRLEDFKNLSDQFYFVVPNLGPSEKHLILNIGYEEFHDFVFVHHEEFFIPPYTPYYSDEYGNTVINNSCIEVHLFDRAGLNNIKVEKESVCGTNVRINALGSNSSILIAENCYFSPDFRIDLFDNTKVSIGYGTSFGVNFKAWATINRGIVIGNDCMFSDDCKIYAGDGHSIFDVTTKERTNSIFDGYRDDVVLGEHVWIGLGSTILSSQINTGSLIGAASLVKGMFPNNVAIAGNPSRVIKKNIAWERNPLISDFDQCVSSQFFNTTIE